MKIRTDFVTNSSSSSFIFEVRIHDKKIGKYTLGRTPENYTECYDDLVVGGDESYYKKAERIEAERNFDIIRNAIMASEKEVTCQVNKKNYTIPLDSVETVVCVKIAGGAAGGVAELRRNIDEFFFEGKDLYRNYRKYSKKRIDAIVSRVAAEHNLDEKSIRMCEYILDGGCNFLLMTTKDTFDVATKTTTHKVTLTDDF